MLVVSWESEFVDGPVAFHETLSLGVCAIEQARGILIADVASSAATRSGESLDNLRCVRNKLGQELLTTFEAESWNQQLSLIRTWCLELEKWAEQMLAVEDPARPWFDFGRSVGCLWRLSLATDDAAERADEWQVVVSAAARIPRNERKDLPVLEALAQLAGSPPKNGSGLVRQLIEKCPDLWSGEIDPNNVFGCQIDPINCWALTVIRQVLQRQVEQHLRRLSSSPRIRQENAKPRWDGELGRLTYEGAIIKRVVKGKAVN
jgi:hypothetical protein